MTLESVLLSGFAVVIKWHSYSNHKMASLLPLLLLLTITVLCLDFGVDGFVIYSPPRAMSKRSSSTTSTTQQYLIDHDLALEMGAARGAFALCCKYNT